MEFYVDYSCLGGDGFGGGVDVVLGFGVRGYVEGMLRSVK